MIALEVAKKITSKEGVLRTGGIIKTTKGAAGDGSLMEEEIDIDTEKGKAVVVMPWREGRVLKGREIETEIATAHTMMAPDKAAGALE